MKIINKGFEHFQPNCLPYLRREQPCVFYFANKLEQLQNNSKNLCLVNIILTKI